MDSPPLTTSSEGHPNSTLADSITTASTNTSIDDSNTESPKSTDVSETVDYDSDWGQNEICDEDGDHPWDALEIEQRQMTQHWAEILDIDEGSIKPDDHFFQLGGDSVAAMRLSAATQNQGLTFGVSDVFKNPTLADMARVMLSTQKSMAKVEIKNYQPFSLVQGKLELVWDEVLTQCDVLKEQVEDIYPCTHMQIAMMALSLIKPQVYTEEHVYELPSDWSLDAFKKSWGLVETENPALRTRIVKTRGAGWLQVIIKLGAHWSMLDDVEKYLERGRTTPMKLGDPLLRVATFETQGKQPLRFVLTIHHAIEDGWSMASLPHKINEAFYNGQATAIARFSSFVEHVLSLDEAQASAYWRSQLQGASLTHFPRLPHPTYQPYGNCVIQKTFEMPKPTQLRITYPTILRAAWSLVLARHAEDDEVIMGITLAGRNLPVANLEETFGPMITTIPLRVIVDQSTTVAEFLRQIHQQSIDMMPFEQYGMEKIQKLTDDASRACQFQNLLIIHPDAGSTDVEQLQHGIRRMSPPRENHLPYALTIECQSTQTGLHVKLCFDDTVVSKWLVERLLYQFTHVVNQLNHPSAESSLQLLQDLELISPQDRADIQFWNKDIPLVENLCIHEEINLQTSQQPNAAAICSWDGELSYSKLDKYSTHLAHHLRREGIQPEVFVPLCFEKSMWAVVAILAVLKAGGAFCLIDPKQPVSRLKCIVDTVGAVLIIGSHETASACSSFGRKFLTVEEDLFRDLDTNFDHCPLPSFQASTAAYVAFTSGSTGLPKGSVIEHRSCVSGFLAQIKSGHFPAKPRVLQFTSYSFDTSIEEILATLMAGGCICIPSETDRMMDLSGFINRMNVDLVELTASAMQLIDPDRITSVKILRQGGEPMNSALTERWADRLQFENSYGPSECCVTSSITRMSGTTDPTNIGKGIGCLFWIVEPANSTRLAPIGTVGELLIQGPIVARGYLKREKESQDAFIQSNFSQSDQNGHPQRTYKTGDLVRYNADGSLSIIGRKDTQVKLRGQRIELGEVEHHVLKCTGIVGAVVLLCKTGSFKDRLVAVVQLLSDQDKVVDNSALIQPVAPSEAKGLQPQICGVIEHLQATLPSYMMPTSWIIVQRLPMLVSGKLDRKMIHAWVSDMSQSVKSSVEITTASCLSDVDRPLTGAFAHELSLQVAELIADNDAELSATMVNQNFDLQAAGLDSIKIVSLAHLIKERYGKEFGMSILADSSLRLQDLADMIERSNSESSGDDADPQGTDWFNELSALKESLLLPIENDKQSSVFITGATGYLGTQILHQALLSSSTDRVIAHVRAPSIEAGERRVIKSAKTARWWVDTYRSKLEIWLGDLSKKRLGLTQQQWNRLCGADPSDPDNISAIVHNGAVVNWYRDYHELKAANVDSTIDVLRAAKASSAIKSFIYISGGPTWEAEEEESETNQIQQIALGNGYEQTKVMSELLVKASAQSLIDAEVCTLIVKPGFIIGDTFHGIANVDDFLWRMVAAVLHIGAVSNKDLDTWVFVTSGESIAEDVVDYLLDHSTTPSATVKVLRGTTVKALWSVLREKLGYSLREVEHQTWLQLLKNDVLLQKKEHPLWPVFHLVERGYDSLGCRQPSAHLLPPQASILAVQNAFVRNVQYLVGIGYLPDADGVTRKGNTQPRFDRSYS